MPIFRTCKAEKTARKNCLPLSSYRTGYPKKTYTGNRSRSLDLNFLYRLTSTYYGKEGQASIDSVVFFKLMLVGYLENISSDRRIVQTAGLRSDILYFIGYDIDEQLP